MQISVFLKNTAPQRVFTDIIFLKFTGVSFTIFSMSSARVNYARGTLSMMSPGWFLSRIRKFSISTDGSQGALQLLVLVTEI